MACDTCGTTGVRLVDLREIYQTDDVKQICDGCEKVINTHLWKVQGAVSNIQRSLMQRFLANMAERFKGSKPDGR